MTSTTEPRKTLPAWAVEVQDVGAEGDGKSADFIRGAAVEVEAIDETCTVRPEQFYDKSDGYADDPHVALSNGRDTTMLTFEQAHALAEALHSHARLIDRIDAAPLVMAPLREFTKQRLFATGDDTYDTYGWCAKFCAQVNDGQPESGRTVADHGLWCHTTIGAWAEALRSDGTGESVGVELANPYTHGTYPTSRIRVARRGPFVRLIVGADRDDDNERTEVHMDPAAARSLAATLLYAADTLDGLDRPVKLWEH